MATKLVLVDGTAYLYRAYHALPPLTGPAGQPTGAVFGVGRMLKALIRQETPDYFAVVLDAHGKTFRHELYPQYKAQRPPMPEDLVAQLDALKRLIKENGYPLLEIPKVEADDVIGTLAHRAEAAGWHVLISTGDKDMAQLISEHVTLVDTMKNQRIDADAIQKKFGVQPEQMIDYLALAGDSADNIPGVVGVGPKTAAKWLCEHQNLDEVIACADTITGKGGKALQEALPKLPLYKDLVTIRCDVELDCTIEQLKIAAPKHERLIAFYKEYGFTQWLKDESIKLVLVDGSAYLYRAYHALPSLTGPAGQPTGAVFGVGKMLKALIRQETPDYFAVVLDAPGKTFRHELYPQYKAQRPPMPEDLVAQLDALKRLIEESGYPLLEIPKVEADDVIGTLAHRAEAAGWHVLISTGDKDMAQLISEHVTLVDTMKNQRMDADAIQKKFGVQPEQMIDYLALTGDSADNIPGVGGVGPKTATKWLYKHQNLDGVIAHADTITGKSGKALQEALPKLPVYKDLVTIRCDVELDCTIEQLKIAEPKHERLIAFYKEYGFTQWLKDESDDPIAPVAEVDTPAALPIYQLILTQSSLDHWLKKLKSADCFALDIETTSLDYMQAQIVGLSFAVAAGDSAYLPLAHDYCGAPKQLHIESVLKQLRPLLENQKIGKLGHNIKYDMEVLMNYGIRLQGVKHDSMLESYIYNSVASRHNLKALAYKYLNAEMRTYEDVAGKGVKQRPFGQIAVRTAGEYAAADADFSLQLHNYFHPRLKKTKPLLKVYEEIEMPLLPVIAEIERNGVLVDADQLSEQSRELQEAISQTEQQVYQLAGHDFNIASPKQIQAVLFDEAKLPVHSKTPKGQRSTSEEVLQVLARDHKLPRLILHHRSLSKLKSTYTDKLPQLINAKTERVHTSYHQAVTSTGRLSSSDPNLQNIPIRTAEGRRIRQAFIARKGYCLIAADYSQIEMRIMAHVSQDPGLLNVFKQDMDMHRATAAEVFGCELDSVSDEQRRIAKAINFGLIYGMSAFGLSKQLDIENKEAAKYVETYFERFAGVRTYMDNTRKQASEQGYVETIMGRRLYLPEINAKDARRRRYAERTAINAPMQGSAADIIKRAMILIAEQFKGDSSDAMMIMQVHDELVIEAAASQADDIMNTCCELMESAAELSVPLKVNACIGNNWDDAH